MLSRKGAVAAAKPISRQPTVSEADRGDSFLHKKRGDSINSFSFSTEKAADFAGASQYMTRNRGVLPPSVYFPRTEAAAVVPLHTSVGVVI